MFGYLCRCLGLARVVQKVSFSQALQIWGNRALPGGQALPVHEVNAERLRAAKKVIGSAPDQSTKHRLSTVCLY